MISESAKSILSQRSERAHARDEESFVKARDIARLKFGIDWPAHGGFVVVSAGEMVLEKKKKGES